jgi:hypothetical protein
MYLAEDLRDLSKHTIIINLRTDKACHCELFIFHNEAGTVRSGYTILKDLMKFQTLMRQDEHEG